MNTMAFYKTNDPAVVAIANAYLAKIEEVRAAGKAFAAHFGGELLVKHNIHGFEIGGLYFTPPIKSRLWTTPERSAMGRQRPRASIVRPTPDEKAALKALNDDWASLFPREKADLEPVLKSIEVSWGDLFFSGGFEFFPQDGFLWVSTSVKVAECMVEVLASEYNAAKAVHEGHRQAA